MRREPLIDFFEVREPHIGIHKRLEAWARWVRVRPFGWQVQPMFRNYRSKAWQWTRPEPKPTVNIPEAIEMERAVSQLPAGNRDAIRWAYVTCDGPARMAKQIGVSKSGLAALIHSGRDRLMARGM